MGVVMVFFVCEDWDFDKVVIDVVWIMGVLVNVVDKLELCDFYIGVLVNCVLIVVVIMFIGVGFVLVCYICVCIEVMFLKVIGELVWLVESFCDVVSWIIIDGDLCCNFWVCFFFGVVVNNFYVGKLDVVCVEVQWLLNGMVDELGFVWLVGVGLGVEDLLMFCVQCFFQEVDVIVYDVFVLVDVVVMGWCDVQWIFVGKCKGVYLVFQNEICDLLVVFGKQGYKVVWLKVGDLMIFGCVVEEMEVFCVGEIGFEIVFGVMVVFVVVVFVQILLILCGVVFNFVFVIGYNVKFEILFDWVGLVLKGVIVVVYMGWIVVVVVVDKMIDVGMMFEILVVVIENVVYLDEY